MDTSTAHGVDSLPPGRTVERPGVGGSSRRDARWQQQLLPLMASMVVAAALFFSALSVFELRQLYARVEQRSFDQLTVNFTRFEDTAPSSVTRDLEYLRFKMLSLLEDEALQRRYQQVNALMLTRVWTRQLGFVTGMLLALVGSAFVLGKLHEETSKLDVEAGGWKGSFISSSPGLVLAVVGAALMGITLTIQSEFNTFDKPVYLVGDGERMNKSATSLPPPVPFDAGEREKNLFHQPPPIPAVPSPASSQGTKP